MEVPRFSQIVRAPLARLVGAVFLLSACGGAAPAAPSSSTAPTAAGAPAATDDNAEVTVWIDSTREAAIKLYKDKHPDVAGKIKFVPLDHPLIRAARRVGTNFGD